MRLNQLVVDCADPVAQSRFWAAVLRGEAVDRGYGWSHVDAPGFPRLAFQPVPERKSLKNRLHLDVEVPDIAASVAHATAIGAITTGPLHEDEQGAFQVMHDPEGNEFCFVTPAARQGR